MNVLSYWLYAQDKEAAQLGNRFIPEQTLDTVNSLGGWCGGWLAQQKLRHKTQKQPFREIYFCNIVFQILLICWFTSPLNLLRGFVYRDKLKMNYSVDQDPNRTLTLVLYILYIIAIFTGGILAIIALIINYVKRSDVQGSIFESHFTWQIRTFWWYFAWNIIAIIVFIPFSFLSFTGDNGMVFAGVAISATTFAFAVFFLAWVWIVYRAIRGLVALNDNKPMYQN